MSPKDQNISTGGLPLVILATERRCLREPIDEIWLAAQLLERAVGAHLSGERDYASELFRASDMPILREWTESLWGAKSRYVQFREIIGAAPVLSRAQRFGSRMPTAALKRELLQRDGYRCRFCGIPVVRAEVRNKLQREYPEAIIWGRSNDTQHAALQAMWLQFDHVLPHSRGGETSMDNLVIACAGCNFARMEYTLAEVGLVHPKPPEPLAFEWDGLERVLSK